MKPETTEYFYLNRRRQPYKLETVCKACRYECNRKWAEANPEKVERIQKKSYLRIRYGTTPEEKEAKYVAQGRCCAICKTSQPGERDWNMDHDHKTGKARGVLCNHCNKALGLLKDSVETAREVVRYLETYGAAG